MTAPPPRPATIVTARQRRGGGGTAGLLGGLALICALLAAAAPVGAVLAFRQGRLDFHTAHDVLWRLVTPGLAVAALALSVLGLVAGLFVRPRRGGAATVALVLGALVLGGAVLARGGESSRLARSPPVHEVSTDWKDPPTFSARVLAARGADADPIESAPAVPEGPAAGGPVAVGFLGRQVADVNARTCPAAAPAVLLLTPPQAYARAKAVVLADSMSLVTDDPAGLTLEATARRGVWGVADDLTVRVRSEGAGARVDLRSAARQGLNDGGANCARITRLRAALGR